MISADLCVIPRDAVRTLRFSAPALIAKLDPKMLPNFFLLFISCRILEAALGKGPDSAGEELVIFLHPSYIPNGSIFLSILPAGRYTFGKPVPGLVSFRVCRKFEHAATTCYGEEAKAVCDEFSGQVSRDNSHE